MTKKPRKRPTVLIHQQVWQITCAPHNLKHRLILMTTYAAGFRAGLGRRLKPEHIDSQRMPIKVVDGNPRSTVSGVRRQLTLNLVNNLACLVSGTKPAVGIDHIRCCSDFATKK